MQADAHVDTRVAQRQRVGVALAAVADDRDLAALDDRQVGVVVVEDLGGSWCGVSRWRCCFLCRRLERMTARAEQVGARAAVGARLPWTGTAADGDRAGLDHLLDAERLEHLEQGSSLSAVPVASMVTRLRGDVDDLGAEQLRRSRGPGERRSRRRATFTRTSSRCTDGRRLQLDDLETLTSLLSCLVTCSSGRSSTRRPRSSCGRLGVLGGPDGERVDVEAAPGEQAGDPGEHAGLVLDQDGEGVCVVMLRSLSSDSVGPRRRRTAAGCRGRP